MRATSSWRRSVGLLAVATMAIGVANYFTSLVAVRLLPADQFADFAAAQSLLLVLGTGSCAALPWAVARYLARSTDPQAAQKAMHFGLTGSLMQAAVLAPVALVVCWSLGGALFGVAGGVATVFISLLAGPTGFLQGREQIGAIAGMRSIETLVRIAVTMLLIFAVSRNAAVVLVAFPVGSAVALVFALRRGRAGFPMRRLSRSVAMGVTRDAALLGGIQVLLAMLGVLDSVYVDFGRLSPTEIASYQAAALLARIPLFFSAAISTAAYTGMAAATSESDAGRQLRSALRTYLWVSMPFLVAYLTMPAAVLHLVIPSEYDQTLPTLRLLCFAGVFVGAINVVTTAHQARGRFRSCLRILTVGVVAQAVALVWAGHVSGLSVFAAAASVVTGVTVLALVRDAWPWLRRPAGRHLARFSWLFALGTATALAAVFVDAPVAWILLLAVTTVCAVKIAFTHDDAAPAVIAGPVPDRECRPLPHARPVAVRRPSPQPVLEELSR